jgi:hypothetical protein
MAPSPPQASIAMIMNDRNVLLLAFYEIINLDYAEYTKNGVGRQAVTTAGYGAFLNRPGDSPIKSFVSGIRANRDRTSALTNQ